MNLIYKEQRFAKCLVFTTIFILFNILFIGDFSSLSKASEHSSLSFSDPLNVNIIHPEKNQSTKVGSNLEIIGTSGYNPDHICHVSVIINDVKPYQETIPTGLVHTSISCSYNDRNGIDSDADYY